MGLNLRSIVKKVGDVAGGVERQVNPFDNGATYSQPQGGIPAPSFVNQAATHLGLQRNQFGQPTSNTGPINFIRNADAGILGVGKSIVNQGVNTLRVPIKATQVGAGVITSNPVAAQNARNQLGTAENNSFATPVIPFLRSTAGAITAPVANKAAKSQEDYARRVLGQAYQPYVAGQSMAEAEAQQAKADILNQQLKTAGLTPNSNVAKTISKQAGSTALTLATVTGLAHAPSGIATAGELVDKAKAYDATQNQMGAVGKNVNKPKATLKQPAISEADMQEMRLGQMHQKAQNPNPVNVSPELANLQNRYETPLEPNTMDQIVAQSTGLSKARITSERDITARKLQAEQVALDHLQNGGTRDEAAVLYQKATGTTLKDAQFQVQRVAREAKQSLNVSKETPNPLLNDFKLPQAKPGEYHVAPANRRAVINSIDLAEKRATAFENQLHPEDKANMADYLQGTKDIQSAHNPTLVTQAVQAARNLFDTTHALGENYGKTKHGENFFPGYYERSPEQLVADRLKAEQDLESQYGTQNWNEMSQPEKDQALADYQPSIPHGEDVNYAGFHSKGKIYKNQQEAIAAGETPLHANPYDAMRRYATGAKLQLGDQAMIQAVRSAEPVQSGTLHTIDLPGGGFVRVGKQGAKALKNEGIRKPPAFLKKVAQKVNRSIVKTIVANPVFHGGNQEFNAVFQTAWRMPGFKPANMVRLIKNQIALKGVERQAVQTEYYAKGGFTPTYGRDQYGFIAKGLEKAGIDPKHAELSPRGMTAIEENIRLGLYKTARDRGMAPEEAIATIDKTLGGPDLLGDMASSYGLFLHYFKTNAKLLGDIGVQAGRGNLMPLTGLAVGYAAWVAANKAWQGATGNPDAQVRAPGVLGTGLQLAKAPGQIKRGQVPTVITSHTNPLLTTGVEQVTNRDLRKPVVGPQSANNNLSGPGGSGRLKKAESNLFGPGMTVQSVTGSKTSVPEALTGYATGLYTPHAKGYQAAPNISLLNKSGAKAGTGLDEQRKFFAAQDKATKLVYGDNRAQAAYDNYLKRDKTSDGKTILLSPEEALSAAAGLSANPKALQAVQALKQGNSNHDPMWDLPTKDLKAFLDYQSTRKTDPELGVKKDLVTFSNGQKLTDFISQRSKYYQDNQSAFGGNGTVPAPGTPEYPKFTTATQNLLNEYDKITDPSLKAKFIAQHQTVGQAFSDVFEYNNKLGVAQGGQALKAYPAMSPDVQKLYSQYLALPQHDGPKGGSKTRSLWIKAHPNEWATITDALTNSALYQVSKEGAKNMYQGESPTQALLRNIYNLGQYDIGKSTDNRGNSTYGIGTAAVAKAKASSSKGSSSGRTKKSVRAYFPTNTYKYGTDKLKVATKKTTVNKSLAPPTLAKAKKFNLGRPKVVLAKAKNRPKVSIKKAVA